MTLKFNWNIVSDDENSRQSFLSDCDSEFDFNPPPRYPAEKCSNSALKKVSINQNEPPITRSKVKTNEKIILNTQTIPKEQHQSTNPNSFDAFTGMKTVFTNTTLFLKKEMSDNSLPNSPTDGVNKLADWFEGCSLDESKINKNCFWSNYETKNYYKNPITSSSPNMSFNSNSFSISQTSPFSIQSSTTMFDQQKPQLWSRFRFSSSTKQDNLWVESFDSTTTTTSSPNLFTSSNTNHCSDQSSSPSQIVPSLITKNPSSSSLVEQRQITHSKVLNKKRNIITQHSSLLSKFFFTLIIFVIGLVFGYFLTNTFQSNLIRQWFFIIWEICYEIIIEYLHLLNDYFQIIVKYFSSIILFV